MNEVHPTSGHQDRLWSIWYCGILAIIRDFFYLLSHLSLFARRFVTKIDWICSNELPWPFCIILMLLFGTERLYSAHQSLGLRPFLYCGASSRSRCWCGGEDWSGLSCIYCRYEVWACIEIVKRTSEANNWSTKNRRIRSTWYIYLWRAYLKDIHTWFK